MLKRFGRKEGFLSVIGPGVFYIALAISIGYSCWPYFYYVKNETLITIGLFATWRYSWQITHYLRALFYRFVVYPRISAKTRKAAKDGLFPDHVFFIIPSYNEEPWVSTETFFSIMSEINRIPSSATLVVATGSDRDDSVITKAYQAHPARYKVELVLQRQSKGKRIAMGHALRAVARRYNDKRMDDGSSVTIFMDGDSYLESGLFSKTLPLFCYDSKLGALTTNELAYINTRSQWYKDWFNLKFGQRHILFQSHSLSRKVLTLTGRFSVFRSSLVVREDFISQIENDVLSHPFHGKFRFLMGDDKSSWFYLLKKGWDMLYIPDAICYSLESRDAKFVDLSISLPYRWYGNTMRNNGRSLALGWRKVGLFIWICILDQRISMWTSLVGITGAIILAIFKNFIYFPIFIAWILIVRTIQMTVIGFNGHPVSILTIPIMLYNQWVGSVIKIKAFFYLSDQKWSKGKAQQDASQDSIPIPHVLARFMPRFLLIMSYTAFFFTLLVTEQVLTMPSVHALQLSKADTYERPAILATQYGIVADDGLDDGKKLNALIAQVENGSTILLPPGTLDIQQPIIIERSNITIKGSGKEQTVLLSRMKTPVTAIVEIAGRFGKKLGKIRSDADIGASVVELSDPGGVVKKDDILLIRQANDDDFFRRIDSKKWRKKLPMIRQTMVQVLDYQNKNLLYLDRKLSFKFEAGKAMVIKPKIIHNVSIQDLTIQQDIPGQDIINVQHRYENLFPEYRVDLLRFIWTAFCSVKNVSLSQAGRHALVFENSFNNSASDLTVIGAWNKGKKGSGYIRFARAFKCYFKNSYVKDIRHITLQWSSSCNVIENIHSMVDINIHGGYPHHNLISNITFNIPAKHKWKPITLAPHDARWAPPNGPGNLIEKIQTEQ